MKTTFFVALLYFICNLNAINAQSTYSFNYNNGYVKRSPAMLEDDARNIMALLREYTGTDYTPQQYYRAGLLKFSPTGDTSTVFYNLGDTVFSLTAMSKAEDAGYILGGQAGLPEIGNSRLLLIKTDDQGQRIWTKQHIIEDVLNILPKKIVTDDHGFYVFGNVGYTISGPWYPFMSRFDNVGNLLRYYIYPNFGIDTYEIVLNPSKNRIWMFSGPTLEPFNGSSKMVFDTSFNYISGEELPIHSMIVSSFKWQSDTSFYVSYLGWRNENLIHDHEFALSLYDTTMNRLSYSEFGDLDSDDYPGFGMPFDFIHPDTIFYTGTIELQFIPIVYGHKNWIMVGQTDKTLQERYRRYIGGDANYWSWNVLALKDGGCFVNTARLNEELLIFDLVFFKLDQYGQLVYTSEKAMTISRFLVYPNPVIDYITVEGPGSGYQVQVFNQDGRLLDIVNAKTNKIQIKADYLKSGMYYLSFLIDGKKIETKKIVKQ